MGSDVGFWGYWHNQSLSVRLSGTIMALHLELERGAYLHVRDCEQSEGDKVNRDEHSSIVGWRKAWFNSNRPKFFYLFALIPNQSQELFLLKHSSILMYKWHYFFWSNELCLSVHIPICCQSISICRHPHLVNWLSYPPQKNKAGDPLCIDYPLSIVFSVTLTQLF